MRSLLIPTLVLLAIPALVGCGSTPAPSDQDTAPVVTAAPAFVASNTTGRRVRFEVVETATLGTAATAELWLPLASREPGVQELEAFDVTLKPNVRSEIVPDGKGNRVLHVKGRGPVDVRVVYKVLRVEVRADLAKAERRPYDAPSRPTRHGVGVRVESFEEQAARIYAWDEVQDGALGWVPYERIDDGPDGEVSVLPADVLVIGRGIRSALPFATLDGRKTWVYAAFRARLLEAP